jgi:DNA-binding FrmR family transcriptional regulator
MTDPTRTDPARTDRTPTGPTRTGPPGRDPAPAEPASSKRPSAPVPPYGYVASEHKDVLVRRMRRIEGQVRGIERMIAEGRYCVDILTQIAAASAALETVAAILLHDHVSHCVRRALASGDEQVADEKVQELLEAVRRFTRTR